MTQLSLIANSLKKTLSTTLDTDVPIAKIIYNLINFWKGAAAPTVPLKHSKLFQALDQDSVVCMKTWYDWEHIQYVAEASSGMFLKIVATRQAKSFILKLSPTKK